MSPRAKSALVLVGVFALGGVSGAAGMRAYGLEQFRAAVDANPREARAKFRMDAMRRRLDLTDDQVAKIEVILKDAEGMRDDKIQPCKGDLDEVRDKTDARILEVLDEGQRDKYRQYQEQKRRGRGKRE
jgi:hypothetical protein